MEQEIVLTLKSQKKPIKESSLENLLCITIIYQLTFFFGHFLYEYFENLHFDPFCNFVVLYFTILLYVVIEPNAAYFVVLPLIY